MENTTIYLTGLALTLIASFAVVLYMRIHLQKILVDLCGTEERAKFWTVFCNVILILTPIVFAMSVQPEPQTDPLYALTRELKWGLVGLIGSVLTLGAMLSRFILSQARSRPQASGEKYSSPPFSKASAG